MRFVFTIKVPATDNSPRSIHEAYTKIKDALDRAGVENSIDAEIKTEEVPAAAPLVGLVWETTRGKALANFEGARLYVRRAHPSARWFHTLINGHLVEPHKAHRGARMETLQGAMTALARFVREHPGRELGLKLADIYPAERVA